MTATAKRGDLVVFEEHHRDFVLHGDNREYDTFTVGVVTAVTRDGKVKMWRRAGDFEQSPAWPGAKPDRGETAPTRTVRSYVMSSTEIDVAGALATAACHVWITDTVHEDHAKAYDHLAEVQGELRPHLKMGYHWITLHDAAVTWENARREAAPMLTAALRERGEAFMAQSAAYHAAVAGANDTYRAAYADPVSL